MNLLETYDNFIFDLDGVFYRLSERIEGVQHIPEALRRAGKSFVFVTNNSNLSQQAYVEKLAAMEIEVGPDQILTSGIALACYLEKQASPRGKKAYVIGGEGLRAALEEVGLVLVSDAQAREARFFVIGWDTEFTFAKMRAALVALSAGAAFYATNLDVTYPAPDGPWPGTGALAAGIAAAAGREPLAVVGKPSPFIMKMALEKLPPGKTLVIGDRLDTDVASGKQAGLDTALVLTGVTTLKMARNAPAALSPEFILNKVTDLLEGSFMAL